MTFYVNGVPVTIDAKDYKAGDGIAIAGNSISVKVPTKHLSKAEYEALTDEQKQEDVLYVVDEFVSDIPGAEGRVPPGAIMSFLGLHAPTGYLVCDGQEHLIGMYPSLTRFLQEQFGSVNYFGGDGVTTFAVPDFRNLFLRGYHGDADEQLSGDIGVKQEATEHVNIYSSISGHPASISVKKINQSSNLYADKADALISPTNMSRSIVGDLNAASDTSSPQSLPAEKYTSRPVNAAVLYCIKT